MSQLNFNVKAYTTARPPRAPRPRPQNPRAMLKSSSLMSGVALVSWAIFGVAVVVSAFALAWYA